MGMKTSPKTRKTGKTININKPKYDPPWSKTKEITKRKTIMKRLINAKEAPAIEVQL